MHTPTFNPSEFPDQPVGKGQILVALALLAIGFTGGVIAGESRLATGADTQAVVLEDWHGNVMRSHE